MSEPEIRKVLEILNVAKSREHIASLRAYCELIKGLKDLMKSESYMELQKTIQSARKEFVERFSEIKEALKLLEEEKAEGEPDLKKIFEDAFLMALLRRMIEE
jgi:uncharacterized protein YihD (DUF1040 family)